MSDWETLKDMQPSYFTRSIVTDTSIPKAYNIEGGLSNAAGTKPETELFGAHKSAQVRLILDRLKREDTESLQDTEPDVFRRILRMLDARHLTETADTSSVFEKDDFLEALIDLHELDEEAREEGISQPSTVAKENATRLMKLMYAVVPERFLVELFPDSSIAVSVGDSVMVVFEVRGDVVIYVSTDDAHRRARYTDATHLPDGFLYEALYELKKREAFESD